MFICEDFEYVTESFNKDSKHIWMALVRCSSSKWIRQATRLDWEVGDYSEIYQAYKGGGNDNA